MTRKYGGLVVLLLSLGCCYALQDEVGYLAYTLNDLARFLPDAVPGGGDRPVGGDDGGAGKPDVKPAPGSGKIAGEAPTLAARNIVHASGDVMQRDVGGIKEEERVLKLSGYVSIYYALSELSRSLKGKEIPISFDEFRQRAFRTIKAYRIEVACRHYIVEQLMASFMPRKDFLKIKFNFGISSLAMWEIYHSLVSDLASVQAKRYVQVNYDPKKDTLQPSPFEVSGKTLISDIAKIVDTRIGRYIEQGEKASKVVKGLGTKRAAIIAQLNEQPLFEKITQITPAKTWKFTSREVLIELHSKNSFGRAEGLIAAAAVGDLASLMPQGFSLGSDEVEFLLWDWNELKNIGLTSQETKDNSTVFDSLNLMEADWGELLAALMETKLDSIFALMGAGTVQDVKNFFAAREVYEIADFFGKNPRDMEYILSILAKPEYYRDNLQAIVKRVYGKVHVFLVDIEYDYRNPNAISNWVAITRYPNKQYVVVDIQNNNRTDDINVQLIQRAFGDV